MAARRWLRVGFWMALLLVAGTVLSAMLRMPGRSHAGPPVPLTADEREGRGRLEGHIRHLAGEIGERNLWMYRGLQAAAHYLEETLRAAGYGVARQEFTAEGQRVWNVEAVRRGAARRDEVVVVGAHYDSVLGCPGADDNASGAAAMLELARRFAARSPARTVRFVGFANEEPPFFQTSAMGSWHYAQAARQRGDRIVAMLSLETIGYYDDTPASQRYPFPGGSWFYPRRANFIGFVGNVASRPLVRRAIGSFRRHTPFPSEGLAAPGWLIGIGWSDHWAFWQEGYAGVMVTDTAPFRNPHYHEPTDTPDTIDYDRLARVVWGLERVVADLAEGE